MSRKNIGVLPVQTLKKILSGYVKGISESYLNPASIDLPLSDEAYRVESTILPQSGEAVQGLLKDVGGIPYDLRNPLEVGALYLIRIKGRFDLPETIYGYANPKSSTGRINLFCRTIADGVPLYDALPQGFSGEIWVLVRPDSFRVLLSQGQAVNQIRLFDGYTVLDRLEMELTLRNQPLLYRPTDESESALQIKPNDDGSLFLTIGLSPLAGGFECLGSSKVLDFGKRDHDSADFFTSVNIRNGRLHLRKGVFYVLSTAEWVAVPPEFSAELRPIDVRLGEFRSHAAGYIDPGWGYGLEGSERGRPITLEIIPHENMMVRVGQAIARIRYERMKEIPEVIYDAGHSNYSNQHSARLSKHFKKFEP